jgi:hypothetical protein
MIRHTWCIHATPLFFIKNNSKNHLIPYHLSLLKNNFENLISMPHQLMPRHISLLKNNSENLSSISHHLSTLKNNSKNYIMSHYLSLL